MSDYRHPRTTAELRANVALGTDDDAKKYGVKPRRSNERGSARKCTNDLHIRNAWDDIYVKTVRDRSWKKYRRKQFKTKS